MSKKLTCGVVLTLMLFFAGAGSAANFQTADVYLGDMNNYVWHNNSTGFVEVPPRSDTAGDPGYRYTFQIQSGDSGWVSGQMGDNFDLPANDAGVVVNGGNLSNYSGYEMTIYNPPDNPGWFMSAIYMNTGWTDSPYGEANNYYQTGWVWLAPGQAYHHVMDFTQFNVVNANHVSDIGFMIGTNIGQGDYFMSPGVPFHVESTVPLPGAVWLLGSGLLGLVGLRRRRNV
ncbi:MAG: VPLPA-CTERM sorting domain-containing protein [Deltaproteobacteria bacterium]|nr:VPLPA-CTERM sorting domain-containing protein [Deltaproteobacteria bacterium]